MTGAGGESTLISLAKTEVVCLDLESRIADSEILEPKQVLDILLKRLIGKKCPEYAREFFMCKFRLNPETDQAHVSENGEFVFSNYEDGKCITFFTQDHYLVALEELGDDIYISSYDMWRGMYTKDTNLNNPLYQTHLKREEFRNNPIYKNLRNFVQNHEDPNSINEGLAQDEWGYHVRGTEGKDIFLHRDYAHLKPEERKVFPSLFDEIESYTKRNGYSELVKHKLMFFIAEHRRKLHKAELN